MRRRYPYPSTVSKLLLKSLLNEVDNLKDALQQASDQLNNAKFYLGDVVYHFEYGPGIIEEVGMENLTDGATNETLFAKPEIKLYYMVGFSRFHNTHRQPGIMRVPESELQIYTEMTKVLFKKEVE
jgi:hypothetical protein